MELSTFLKLWVILLSITMLVCMMTCTIGKQWVELKVTQKDGSALVARTNGLWKECVGDDNGKGFLCRNVENQPQWMITGDAWLGSVRALSIVSCIVGFIAMITAIVGIFRPKLTYIAIYSCLVAGVLITAALVVFHRDNHWVPKYNFDYGWTFHTGVASAVISGIAFLLGLFICVYVEDKEVKNFAYTRTASKTQC